MIAVNIYHYFILIKKYKKIYDRIRYLIMLKSNISSVYSNKYAKIKINSDDDLSLEKALNMYNVVIPIKSVLNENHDHCCYQTFSEKCSNK